MAVKTHIGLVVLAFVVSTTSLGYSNDTLSRCPSFPQTAATGQVSLHVGVSVDDSRLVCVRAVHGFDTGLSYTGFSLERKNSEGWSARIFPPPKFSPGGMLGGVPVWPSGTWLDRELPYDHRPLPSGRYRVRLRYSTPDYYPGDLDIYSDEVVLP